MSGEERGSIDISSFRDRPIHEDVYPIIWLHGVWRSENGKGTISNMPSFAYAEEIQFSSVGQPGLNYSAFSWNPDKKMPMHQEAGFIRIETGTNNLSLIVAQNIGLAVVEEGTVADQTITFMSRGLQRMSFAKGTPVTATKRVFTLKNDRELEQILYMSTDGSPLTEHLRATYQKVD